MRITDEMVDAAIREWALHTGVEAVPFQMRPTLEAALAAAPQAEPEPVAYIHRQGRHWEVSEHPLAHDEKARGWTEEPLYTVPPPAAPQWVSCAESLPEAGVEVLVWLAAPVIKYGCQIAIDTWDEQHETPVAWSSATIPIGEGWDSGADWQDITHWMPLPAAPGSER